MLTSFLLSLVLLGLIDAQHFPSFDHGYGAQGNATCIVQGDCVSHDRGLTWLSTQLSPAAVISCRGSPLQLYNAGRYWGEQYGKNASVVVFPATPDDVSLTVQATLKTPLGRDYAFVSGAHSQTNASSSYDFVIDLTQLNQTNIIHNFTVDGSNSTITAIAYQGGATSEQVTAAVTGSGFTAVTARVGNVGMGGFSTGGGIGFLAGPYGYAIDRLVAMEVVLPGTGKQVTATAQNEYSDLFWALRGGGGQFGIVTRFYQRAAAEPTTLAISLYYINETSIPQSQSNVVDFFDQNQDPFALIYYATAFIAANPLDPNPDPSTISIRTILVTLWIGNPLNPSQPSSNATFANVLKGLSLDESYTYDLSYLDLYELLDAFFPYGFRRGFFGPQTTNISTSYLQSVATTFSSYIDAILAKGQFPSTALWALQYMPAGLNGNLPASNADTAWPHAVAGHQTLFSPAWQSAADDAIMVNCNNLLNQITWNNQAKVGPVLGDYPNYISPGDSGERVWGDNVKRLVQVKQKYDPECTIHNGRVFASEGCVRGGWANIFP